MLWKILILPLLAIRARSEAFNSSIWGRDTTSYRSVAYYVDWYACSSTALIFEFD